MSVRKQTNEQTISEVENAVSAFFPSGDGDTEAAVVSDVQVFVSFSGGADSLALLHALALTGPKNRFRAVHFEHGIRGDESRSDAAFCSRCCESLGVALDVIELAVPSQKRAGEADEEAARRLRHEAWHRIAETVGGSRIYVFLAHHADDAVETLFLRLFRGSNASGLAGLRSIRDSGRVRFLRPFLSLARSDLEAYLRRRGVTEWRTDSTNLVACCGRNRLRLEILPEIYRSFPYSRGGLIRACDAILADAEFLDAEAGRLADDLIRPDGALAFSGSRALPSAMFARVLRLWLSSELGRDVVPDANLLRRLTDGMARFSGEPLIFQLRGIDSHCIRLFRGAFRVVPTEEPPARSPSGTTLPEE